MLRAEAPRGPRAGASISVVLDELDSTGVRRDLAEPTATALDRSGLVEVRPLGGGRWQLLPCGRVGAVRIGELQVQVTPKDRIGLSRLLFLLGYASDPGFLPEDVDAVDEPDLWPALAESLARQAEHALVAGVLQGYVTREDALQTVRGRIRIGDQISRRSGMLVPLEVSYDDYTVDIVENQILRSAMRRMLAVPRINTDVRARLAHLDGRMSGVYPLLAGTRLPKWYPTRLNLRYQGALRISEIVLRHLSAEPGPGGVPMAAFVVSMWQVYEDFVTTALTEALAHHPGRTRDQYRGWLDAATPDAPQAIPIRPDLVYLVDGRPVVVVDAKYKAASPYGRYPNADQYQMLAYCTALRVRRAFLVYAQGDRSAVRRIRNTDISVVEYPLDLSAAPKILLEHIKRLADEISRHRVHVAD